MTATDTEQASTRSTTLREFFASLSTIKGDLSSITAPPFILADRSAVEYPASWAENPAILCAPASVDDPKERARLVLRWYLASLKRQQYAGGNDEASIKKPLNPFLGELFFGHWDDDAGTTTLVSEQVSHHPPVTACKIANEKHGVEAEGYTAQEITLGKTGTVSIRQVGHAVVSIAAFGEKHLVTLPDVQVRGVLTGSPYPELAGKAYIISTSGYISEIDFSGKSLGGLIGKKNNLEVVLYHKDKGRSHPLYEVSGQWNDKFTFKDVESGKDIETVDTSTLKPSELSIAPVEEQDPWESRHAWSDVINAVRKGDMQGIADSKSKLENAQREQRSKRTDEWKPLFFKMEKSDELFESLSDAIGEDYGYERTGGVWKFDGERAKETKKPFRGDTTPFQ